MAESHGVQKYVVLDPRLDVSETFKRWFVVAGSPDITCQVYPTSQYSNSQLSFNIPIPNSTRCVIDRSSAIISLPVRLTFSGTGAGGAGLMYQPLCEGLRSNPFDKIVATSTINMNGNSITYQNYEQMLPMERFDANRNNAQICPTMCDCVQTYSDAFGFARSPFANYLSNPCEITRSAYPMNVTTNTNTSAVIDLVLFYNIFDYPPFSHDCDVVGINITPFTLNYTFINNLAHIWSRDMVNHTQAAATTSIAVTLGSNTIQAQPRISMNILSLPDGMTIPESISYPYHLVTHFPSTTATPLAQGVSLAQQGTQIIQLDTVPAKIYLYVKVATQTVLQTTTSCITYPDVFAKISRISITFGNKNNLLASMNPQDLYTMTKKNGLSDKWSFSDWNGSNYGGVNGNTNVPLSGSIVCIDPSRDLSIPSGLMCGKSDKINFQALIDFTTIAPYTINYDVCVLCVYDGIQTMRGTQMDPAHIVIGSEQELQRSPMSYNQMKSLYGGVIAGDAKSFFRNVWGKIKQYAGPINQALRTTGLLSKLAPFIPYVGPTIAPFVKAIGYGEGEGEGGSFYGPHGSGGYFAGEGEDYGDGEGEGVLAGGKIMRRSQLKKRMTNYRK